MCKPKIPKGYTILPRIIQEQAIWEMSPLHLKVYLYLVNKASHVTNDKYERGVCLVTISEIQDACTYMVGYRKERPTKNQINNVLRFLRKTYEATDENHTKEPMITTTKTTRGMFVKVHGYSFYQDPKNYENHNENDSKEEANTTTKTTKGNHYIQEHRIINQEIKDNSAINRALENEFSEWWNLYNKKKDKKTAFNKFKLVRKKYDFDVIMNGTKDYLKTITDKQYQKYPKTFLHNESFLNDFSEDFKTTDKVEDYYNDLLGE
ncbi:hypothetical protein EVU91_13035 [Macrococcoides bohemicum]|uniref:hypothetical protein n=1 Tax=Macrococcoides bohemicum TaxID=1903056 RepID=UPI001059308C|nr:hypothetical protein [Macrococcus bohemicus]TDL33500.1 hypothetical protein EVU91_13035 [Macrococcus bohemicus]